MPIKKILGFFLLVISVDLFGADVYKSIPRRVLILDFVIQQRNANADYLSVTIAEALIDPLKKTQKFEIIPRSLADKF